MYSQFEGVGNNIYERCVSDVFDRCVILSPLKTAGRY